MKINWIEARRGSKVILEKCEFADFTLLVGKTGVGKSEILSIIQFFTVFLDATRYNRRDFQEIAARNFCGADLKISFEAGDGRYVYEVALEPKEPGEDDRRAVSREGYVIARERLAQDGKELFYRDKNAARFLSYGRLPRAAADRSLFLTFPEENICKIILSHFQKVHFFTDVFRDKEARRFLQKLAGIYEKDKPLFEEIKAVYFSVFSDLIDMTFDSCESGREIFRIRHSNGRWVSQYDISAGMFKTLNLVTLMKMTKEPSVLLIDEIENSLGANCLDVVVEELSYTPAIQCVITSHHPYVINNIPPDKWKVVSRNGEEITVRNADELGIGETGQDSFYQLINAFHYEDG